MRDEDILPLTAGLLASGMQRLDHAAFAPVDGGDEWWSIKRHDWRREMVETMDAVMVAWLRARRGDVIREGLMEEFTGKGFYAVGREAHYAGMLADFPTMAEIALSRLQACRGVMDSDH